MFQVFAAGGNTALIDSSILLVYGVSHLLHSCTEDTMKRLVCHRGKHQPLGALSREIFEGDT